VRGSYDWRFACSTISKLGELASIDILFSFFSFLLASPFPPLHLSNFLLHSELSSDRGAYVRNLHFPLLRDKHCDSSEIKFPLTTRHDFIILQANVIVRLVNVNIRICCYTNDCHDLHVYICDIY